MNYAPEAPHVDWNLSSVDWVSEVIVQVSQVISSCTRINLPTVYNINHPSFVVGFSTLITWVKSFGYKIYTMPYENWCHTLAYIPEDNPLFPLVPTFTRSKQFPHSSRKIPCDNTKDICQDLSVSIPDFSEAIFRQLLNCMIADGLIPPPTV